jgi:hypothetical protein
LQDVDAASSIAERLSDALRRAEEAQCQVDNTAGENNAAAECPTPSTMDDTASEDQWSAEAPTSADITPRSRPASAARGGRKGAREAKAAACVIAESDRLEALRRCLESRKWVGRRGDSYELSLVGEMCWTCIRKDNAGSKKFTVSYDDEYDIVWWGTDKAYYTDAADLAADGVRQISWYAASDWSKQKVRFAWSCPPDEPPAGTDHRQGGRSGNSWGTRAAKAKWSVSKVQNNAVYAVAEYPQHQKANRYATWW